MSIMSDCFRVGQKAVYPCHGVGTIEDIQQRDIGGFKQDFYVLKIHSTGAKVMVPTSAARTSGLRSVIEEPQVKVIYDILKSPSKRSRATWNRRFRALNDKLQTGRLEDIAEVLRDLSNLRRDKDLSFGEKKMLEKAREMIVNEISASRGQEASSVEIEINSILKPTLDL